MEVFSAAPHHDIFLLVFQVGVLLLAARIMGEIATRLGQPSVIGEILAGILLGPSLLSGLFPAFGELIISHTDTQVFHLYMISLLVTVILLLESVIEFCIVLFYLIDR